MIVKGGHAVLLRVQITADEISAAQSWLTEQTFASGGEDYVGELKTRNPHLTLAFCGRDLDAKLGDKIIKAASECLALPTLVPPAVLSTGVLAVYGRRDHLVAEVDADFHLTRCRDLLVKKLLVAKVPVSTRYAFKPHVSLAKLQQATTAPHPQPINPVLFTVLGIDVKLGSTYVSL